MANPHDTCNGSGQVQDVKPETGEVVSKSCWPCGGSGRAANPQRGGNNKK